MTGYDVDLDFGFCRVVIRDKNLSYAYKQDFVQQINNLNFEKKVEFCYYRKKVTI